jgi:hypothetical protein
MGVVLGVLMVVEVAVEYDVLVVLSVYYDFVFCICSSGYLVSYVLGMDVCIG